MISAKDKDSRKRGNMENNMSISEKELKLLLNFIKDDLEEVKKEKTAEEKDERVDKVLKHIQQFLED